MPNLQLSLNLQRPSVAAKWTQKEGLRHVANLLQGAIAGTVDCSRIKWGYDDTVAIGNNAYLSPASALITFASSSGDVGATIGGVDVLVTWGTSDTASATAFAAAVRASAINRGVTATNKLAKMTMSSVDAGDSVTVWGVKFTAIANGATPRNHGEFSVGGTNTACATALAAAINRHPQLAGVCVAASAAAVVYVGNADDRTPAATEKLTNASDADITINTAVPTAGAVTMVIAMVPGIIGNLVSCVASGTNVADDTNGTTGFLGGGTGGSTPTNTQEVAP